MGRHSAQSKSVSDISKPHFMANGDKQNFDMNQLMEPTGTLNGQKKSRQKPPSTLATMNPEINGDLSSFPKWTHRDNSPHWLSDRNEINEQQKKVQQVMNRTINKSKSPFRIPGEDRKRTKLSQTDRKNKIKLQTTTELKKLERKLGVKSSTFSQLLLTYLKDSKGITAVPGEGEGQQQLQ